MSFENNVWGSNALFPRQMAQKKSGKPHPWKKLLALRTIHITYLNTWLPFNTYASAGNRIQKAPSPRSFALCKDPTAWLLSSPQHRSATLFTERGTEINPASLLPCEMLEYCLVISLIRTHYHEWIAPKYYEYWQRRWSFFQQNQLGGKNGHKKMSPFTSQNKRKF